MNNRIADALEELEEVTYNLAESRQMLEYMLEYLEEENPTNNHAQDAYRRLKLFGSILLGKLGAESERLNSIFDSAHRELTNKEAQ